METRYGTFWAEKFLVSRPANADRQVGGDARGTKRLAVIGEAYVHGIMKGDLWGAESENSTARTRRGFKLERLSGRNIDFKNIELI